MRVSPLFKDPRSIGDINILKAMLQFVRETYQLLADPGLRDDWELHRLRRYFSVVVENFADGLASLERHDRLPSDLRASIFKSCDDWCSLGRRSDVAQARESRTLRTAAESYDGRKGPMLAQVTAETRLLSSTAADAMAALCVSFSFHLSHFQFKSIADFLLLRFLSKELSCSIKARTGTEEDSNSTSFSVGSEGSSLRRSITRGRLGSEW